MPTELEILEAHFASLDAHGAPTIELAISKPSAQRAERAETGARAPSERDPLIGAQLFTLQPSGDRWTVEPGGAERAAFLVSAHWADLLDLIEGYGSVDASLIDGRLKIAGDLVLAMRWVPRLFTSGSRPGPSSSNRGP